MTDFQIYLTLGIFAAVILAIAVDIIDMTIAALLGTSLMMVFGLLAIFGGVSAMGRLNAVYAVLGGVFGVLSIGFYIGALLSFVGLVLVMKSYNEFAVKKISLDLSR